MPLSLEQGKRLVKLARKAIITSLNGELIKSPKLNKSRGLFVTLKFHPSDTLKGCIGFITPQPLGKAIIDAARSAAFQDTRFSPVNKNEFEDIKIELSVLTSLKEVDISSEKDLNKINIGEDGLMVKKDFVSGLLLPQVATEEGWNEKNFIRHTCIKAGLSPEAWKQPFVKVFKFQAQIFKETSPDGEVIEETIKPQRKKRKTKKRPKRNFVLFLNGENTDHIFTGFMPRDAALKAATRGFKDIKLRERKTKKLHIYEGWREKVEAPIDKPDWMPEEVWKSNVKKIGVEHLE